MLTRKAIYDIVQFKIGRQDSDFDMLFDAALQAACVELCHYGDFRFLQRVASLSLIAGTHTYDLPPLFHCFGKVWGGVSLQSPTVRLDRMARESYEADGLDVDNDTAGVPGSFLAAEPLTDPLKSAGTISTSGIDVTGVGTAFTATDVGLPLATRYYARPRIIASWTNGTTIKLDKAFATDLPASTAYAISPPPRPQITFYPKPSVSRIAKIRYIGKLWSPALNDDFLQVPEDIGWLMVMWTVMEFHGFEQDEVAVARTEKIVNRLLQKAVRNYSDTYDSYEIPNIITTSKRLVRNK